MNKKISKLYTIIGIIIVTIGILFVNSKIVLAEGPNLIQNSGLETSDPASSSTPQYWTLGGWGQNDRQGIYPVVGSGFGGPIGARVQISQYTDGDVKWVFNPVNVEPGALYTFSDIYSSTGTTSIVAALTSSDGTLTRYITLDTLKPTTVSTTSYYWNSTNYKFTIPTGYSKVTVYHALIGVGSLTTDYYSLTQTATADQNLFPQGMVSLTFDDGWSVLYDNALPILKNSNMKATYYLISDTVTDADNLTRDHLLDQTAHPDVNHVTTTISNEWNTIYIDPTNQNYRFTDSYTSTATSTVEVSYILNGHLTTQNIGILPASPNSSKTASLIFTLPLDAPSHPSSTVSPINIKHYTTSGTLTVFTYNLTGYHLYMNSDQIKEAQANGIEMGNHTVNHCNLVTGWCPDGEPAHQDTLTSAQEIANAQNTLHEIGATPVDTLAYPYGAYNDEIKGIATSSGIIAARSVNADFNTRYSDKLALNVQIVDYNTALNQMNKIKGWIDDAAANKFWLVLVFHQVENYSDIVSHQDWGAITPEQFTEIVNYLNTQKQNNNISVKTLHEGVGIMNTPLAPIPNSPTVNITPGIYNSTKSIELSSNGASLIRYTLDGTLPNCSTGSYARGINYINSINIYPSLSQQVITAVGCNVDNVGSVVSSFVYTIDDVYPIITLGEYDNQTLTNQDITVTASTTEGIMNEISHTFLENGTFTFTATDLAGNVASTTVTITNIDKTAPTIDTVSNITQVVSGQPVVFPIGHHGGPVTPATSAYVNIVPPIAHDNIDLDTPSQCNYRSGMFPLGVTTVTCLKTDTAGNEAAPSIFTVTVVNNIAKIPLKTIIIPKTR